MGKKGRRTIYCLFRCNQLVQRLVDKTAVYQVRKSACLNVILVHFTPDKIDSSKDQLVWVSACKDLFDVFHMTMRHSKLGNLSRH